MHDLVIRNGTIVDGTGQPRFAGDVAIDGDTIVQVGGKAGPARRELDAGGRVVAPGWVDIHTHYDAQATWDPYLTPSSWHGVTTCVMGNCGVGFAPVKPSDHDYLISLMEAVEDIPGTAMHEGIQWGWESFAEYMDVLGAQRRALDIAVQVPHGALRVYVMGERGANNDEATSEDVRAMSALVRDAVRAGALGVSTSRTLIHRASSGEPMPGTFASRDELFGLGRGLREGGGGVFQMTSNHVDMDKEFEWMRVLSKEIGQPVIFNLLQTDEAPDLWRKMLALVDEATAEGSDVYPCVAARPAGILMGWQCTAHPFFGYSSYWNLIAGLDTWEEKLAALKNPEVRKKIVEDVPADLGEFANFITKSHHKMFALRDDPDYEPTREESVAERAAREGRRPSEVAYDLMMEKDGQGLMYFPIFNYSQFDMDPLREMLLHPRARVALGDGGAHCGVICDASIPTFLLTHWARDRRRGETLPLEWVVKRQTSDTASLYGFHDRGVLAAGRRADINVIDHERLTLHAPRMVFDLPAGGRRLIQEVDGYGATIVAGQPIFLDGEPTGSLPGRLVRGRPAPRG
jgi:N-acyl-D-amino-acid deacylase